MQLNKLSLTEVVDGIKTKKFLAKDVYGDCLAEIKSKNKKLNAYLSVFENGEGIPVAVKDNFNVKGEVTTASSNILKNYVSPYDATVVKKLKENNFSIIGKTNMDAFAHGSSTETSDFGPTLNPWNTDYLPGGSSGGSAAAVAANMCTFAIGSETAGSIRGPAAWCGIVGLKPTYGRISRYGLIAMCSSTDCPGPLTKTVNDARIVYNLLKGQDSYDATSQEFKSLKSKSIKSLTIGLPKEYFRDEAQEGVNKKIMDAAKVLEKLGAKLVEVSTIDPKYAISVYTIIQRSEVSSNLARMDGIRYGFTRNQFNSENKRRIMLGTYTLQAGYYDAYYKKAQKVRTLIVNDFANNFEKVDLLLAPTMPSAAPKLGVTKGQSMYGELADILTEPSAMAGLPAISVPAGLIDGLPIGMQLIGPQTSEDLLLDTAEAYEISTHHWS
ncbi:MAG: amidase family protein [bacterium]|nr:amidase family protein [bacterium]